MTQADDVFAQAAAWNSAGERVALATVIETWGSAPRPRGSHMAVTASGRLAGSVSGGCVEAAVADAARTVLATGTPALLEYGISNDSAWEVGLTCGGRLAVFVERLG
jgi:xanthine/CO dehydrogenase XdhC/CoxF family maturation factor